MDKLPEAKLRVNRPFFQTSLNPVSQIVSLSSEGLVIFYYTFIMVILS